jgi:RNA polymerase sigma-70 factor (ECF subfamily)
MTETDADSQPLDHLMHLAQQGDKRAYATLFQDITPLLKGFIARRLSAKSDVDDIVQDILLSIHRASHTYDPNRSFKIWMFTIARHRLSDHLRQLYRKGSSPEINIDDIAHKISADNVTEFPPRYEYLNAALESLPDKQKKIVTMMKIEGHTAEETAKAMNMSLSAVKVSAHRAYKALALKIKQEE